MRVVPHLRIALLLFVLAFSSAYMLTRFGVTEKYESTTVIFTPNTHANIHLVSAGMRFGYDKEIGEQLEMLSSNAVRDALVKEFDLINVYDLDTTEVYWLEKLQKKYSRNVRFNRTVNKSIEISVRDADAQRAAAMANRLVELADLHKNAVVQRNVALAADAAYTSYQEKAALITEMTDSLEALRQAGESVWTFGEERKSGRYQNYELQYRKELERFLDLKMRWEELHDLKQTTVPKSYVVSAAFPASKPIYPKKGLLSLLAGLVAALGYIFLRNTKLS